MVYAAAVAVVHCGRLTLWEHPAAERPHHGFSCPYVRSQQPRQFCSKPIISQACGRDINRRHNRQP